VSPNLCEPELKDSVRYVTDDETMNCCAVKLPCTVKLELITALPVTFNVDDA
jgi:hypothetical protein